MKLFGINNYIQTNDYNNNKGGGGDDILKLYTSSQLLVFLLIKTDGHTKKFVNLSPKLFLTLKG